jgi:hypothetical protein
MGMPSPSDQELIAEHIAARAPIKMTAKALGIKPKELVAWWRWVDKWAPSRGRPACPSAGGNRLPGHIGGRLMRYHSCTMVRIRHAEAQVSAISKPAPIRHSPYPKSKDDRAAKNPRVEVDRIGGGRRTLWTRP